MDLQLSAFRSAAPAFASRARAFRALIDASPRACASTAILPLALGAPGCYQPPCPGFDGVCEATVVETDEASPFTCDYSNPCTITANCTPCSELPRAEQRLDACTPDDELPPFCAGRRGCVEVPWTGKPIACFPVAGTDHAWPPGPQVGKCCAGTCVLDEVACDDPGIDVPVAVVDFESVLVTRAASDPGSGRLRAGAP